MDSHVASGSSLSTDSAFCLHAAVGWLHGHVWDDERYDWEHGETLAPSPSLALFSVMAVNTLSPWRQEEWGRVC